MPDYVDPAKDPWIGSPFAWIRTRPSRQVGTIGEQLVAGWAAAKGLDVVRTGDSDADRVINGKRIEIKFSMLWTSGRYVFQQIRDQRYDYALLLAISPFTASCWVVPKSVLMERPFSCVSPALDDAINRRNQDAGTSSARRVDRGGPSPGALAWAGLACTSGRPTTAQWLGATSCTDRAGRAELGPYRTNTP